jgi:hypothetical protein
MKIPKDDVGCRIIFHSFFFSRDVDSDGLLSSLLIFFVHFWIRTNAFFVLLQAPHFVKPFFGNAAATVAAILLDAIQLLAK